MTVTLPVQASLGTWTAAGSPIITISSANVFGGTAPSIAFNSDAVVLLNFDRLSSSDFTAIFSQLGTALKDISPGLNINPGTSAELPFLGEQVNQLVDFNQMATDLANDLSIPTIVGQPVAPADGQLSADALFAISIGGGTPVSVKVAASSTTNNQSLDSLVQDVNSALSVAGLSGQITASRNGGHIVLTAASSSVTQFQLQIASPTNPSVTQLGFAQSQSSALLFKFSTIQSLSSLLSSLTGISTSPQFDPTTNHLSFTLDFQDAGFAETLPLDFSTGLGPLAFEGAATATVKATASLTSTFEIDLSALQAILTGTAAAPSNGQLSGDAHFALAVGSQSPVNVTVTAATTQNNTGVADLVTDLNNALTAAGLGGAVVAAQSGGVITLTELNGQTLQLIAAVGDPATTALHLPSQATGPDFNSNVFLDGGAQLSVSATVSATGISGSASVGMLAASVQNASLSFSVMTGLTLNGNAGVSIHALINPATNATLSTPLPVTATLQGQFPVTVTAGPGMRGGSGSLALSLAKPNDLTSVTVTPSAGFTAALGGFASLNLDDVQQALDGISGLLSGSLLGAFTTPLPLLGKSLSDLLGTSSIFSSAATALGNSGQLSALQNTVQSLSAALRTAIESLPANVPNTQLINIAADLRNAGNAAMQTAAGLAGAIVATAGALTDEIQTLEQTGIDASVLSGIASVITQMQNASPSLQGLANEISSALGISAPSTLSIQLVTATSPTNTQDQDLEVMLDLKPTYSKSINLSSLNLGGGLGPLNISGGGSVNVTIGGNAEIDFGYDITNPGVFLLSSTNFGLTAQISAPVSVSRRASAPSVCQSVPMRRSHWVTRPATAPPPCRSPRFRPRRATRFPSVNSP